MWCAEVNAAPNATTATRSLGGDNTHFWCLPRSYCAPCVLDHDCPRGADGTQQHCLADANGAGFCAPQCTGNDSCALDAICTPSPWGVCAPAACQTDTDCQAGAVAEQCVRGSCRAACAADADCPTSNGIAQHCVLGVCSPPACESDDDCPVSPAGFFQHCNQGVCAPECGSAGDCDPDEQCADYSMCKPRAGVCVGDGSFCSPCHSDFDCPNGYCLAGQYSGERFCSQTMAAGTSCSATTPPAAGACPARPADANYKGVSCTTAPSNFAPANECIGVVSLAGQFVPGCWTVNQ
jgi:hypothetical protein